MVKFSVLPTLVSWMIVFPYFLCLANRTGGRVLDPGITRRPADDNSYVTSKTSVPNSAASQPARLNDSSTGSGHARSLYTTGSNNSSRVIGETVYPHNSTTWGLTLMDLNGPLIYRQGDDPGAESSHIRVKRGLNYSDEEIANYLPDDDLSNARNELEDIYPDASMRRRKRYAQARDRKTRKGVGGRHHKGSKSKHPEKHTKKHKKVKKPGAAKAGTSHLVDDLQVEAHVEKRDSGDPKSEIEINKREVSEKSEDKRNTDPSPDSRVEQHQDDPGSAANEKSSGEPKSISKREETRHSGCGNENLRYYDDVYEPDPQPLDDIGPRFDPADKMRKKTAVRSVQQIRELVEKLTGKVDEIESYLKSGNIEGGTEADEEGSSNPVRSVDRADFNNNATKDVEARVCAEETEAASKSKLDLEKMSGRKRGAEQKEKTPEGSTELKRSTMILKRREASKKSRNKRKPHRKWDRWTDWSSCSVTCGKGRQIRWRHCTHDCTLAETEMEEKSCQLPACSPGKFLGIF